MFEEQTDKTAIQEPPKPERRLADSKPAIVTEILTINREHRLTEEESILRFRAKFPRDPSGRILLPAQTRPSKKGLFEYIDVTTQNMPANESYPNGMFCSFNLKAKAKTHMDHRGVVVAVKASDVHLDQDGIHKMENTAIEIQFVSGVLLSQHTQSVDVARFLYQHPMYGLMWEIDQYDPGGFWRLVGLVEEYTQTHTRMRSSG